ncbi:YqaJ viral recombinase family protein [Burkholderia cenocepacia]|uniref:YqaJ viral recombinase family protein n=1 Tax=Burkholderia cenocepacia TaxID=95486 RepID=UPI001CF12BA5|nr:YqaJ viral recombinase family protein [Burkholderia cenocepacia]MCA8237705.1 YqaJ viral recombinase family protein [Burkholderia cenocepacia]
MTERVIHSLTQGSPEWLQFRLSHFGASEAAAMLGLSSKVKRTELLHMKHTGTPKEFHEWVQKNILDYGHEVEALARPIVEEIIGDDLYPVTCSLGAMSASCDGLTMTEDVAFEHKQYNATLAAAVRAGELPDEYMPQCQQIMLVTGAKKVIFVVSDGTRDNFESIEVFPDEAWFERIRAGWEQFAKDLAEYQPLEIPEKPQADAIMALPALAVQIRGEVITSNLPAFKAAAEQFIASIKTDLETDEDFVNADATVKFCEAKEKEIAVAMDAAIAQMSSIDELMRTGKHVSEQLRTKRLALSNQIEQRKKQIKETAVAERRQKYADHVAALNAELGVVSIVVTPPDFVGVIKGLKTIVSLYDKLDTALANGKIAADAAAKDLRAKLDWYTTQAAEHAFLFRDLQQLIQKPTDDFQLAVNARVDEHKRQEAEKEAKRKADEVAAQQAIPAAQTIAPVAPAPISRPAPVVQASVTSTPTLRLGQINEQLAPLALTAEGLAALGFKHAATDKAAKLYHEEVFPEICAALVRHIEAVAEDLAHAA